MSPADLTSFRSTLVKIRSSSQRHLHGPLVDVTYTAAVQNLTEEADELPMCFARTEAQLRTRLRDGAPVPEVISIRRSDAVILKGVI